MNNQNKINKHTSVDKIYYTCGFRFKEIKKGFEHMTINPVEITEEQALNLLPSFVEDISKFKVKIIRHELLDAKKGLYFAHLDVPNTVLDKLARFDPYAVKERNNVLYKFKPVNKGEKKRVPHVTIKDTLEFPIGRELTVDRFFIKHIVVKAL